MFYTRHIDGPYYYVPFASCYRMIIGLDKNEEIATIFPMLSKVAPPPVPPSPLPSSLLSG